MTERKETTRRTTNQQRNRIKSKISTTTTKKEVNETQQKNGLKWTSSSSRTTVKVVGRLGRRFPTKEKNEWKGPTTTSNNSSPFENKKEEEAVLPSFSLPGFYRVGSRLIKEDEILLVSISSQKKITGTGFYRVYLLGVKFAEFSDDFLGLTQFYWILLGFP